MKRISLLLATVLLALGTATADVRIDAKAFGDRLGGWNKRGKQAAEYGLSGATYRTYKPEITPTPDGGIFVSLRIDHVRGWLSSDDHAVLEITVGKDGTIVSAQSSIAIQGRSITSDLIRGGTDAGQQVVGVDRAVKIGTDLVADLSAKMLREKIVEAGRVSFPAALRHNYNLLYQSIRVEKEAAPPVEEQTGGIPTAPVVEDADGAAKPGVQLDIKTFGGQGEVKPLR
jgi:hypothetical protein